LKELRTTARRGYGLAINEAEPGVTAIAAAIRSGMNGATVGTVSIAGPTVRMTESRVRELAPLVTQCATELSGLWPVRPKAGMLARSVLRRGQRTHDGRFAAKDVGKAA
jgi:IclR family acetate operon transcriptional repressor